MNPVLFWDFHGTLIYPDSLWSPQYLKTIRLYFPESALTEQEIRQAFPKGGYPWDHPEKEHIQYRTAKQWWTHMESIFFLLYTRCGFTESQALLLSQNTRKQLIQPDNVRFYPDVRPQLQRLSQMGFRNIVLSNHLPELDEIIAAHGYSDLFEQCISSACYGYEKPRPELFALARRLAGNPKECWMIGDQPVADIQGGKNAGFHTILLRGKKSNQADFCCNDLYELEQIFQTLKK